MRSLWESLTDIPPTWVQPWMMVKWSSGGDDDGYHDNDGGYHDDDGDYHEAGDYDDCNSCVYCLHLDSLLLPLLSQLILDNR